MGMWTRIARDNVKALLPFQGRLRALKRAVAPYLSEPANDSLTVTEPSRPALAWSGPTSPSARVTGSLCGGAATPAEPVARKTAAVTAAAASETCFLMVVSKWPMMITGNH